MAGNPPAVGSLTPGVVRMKVSVIKKVQNDIAAPSTDASGLKAPAIRAAAVASSITPKR